jgi:hypothetical protein
MDRLGIGWDVLHKLNPRLVYGGSSGFGLDGPYRDLAAMDVTIQAMSGIMNATGFPDRPPVKAGPAVCDFLGGVHLFAGILGALVQRERTGRGQFVEVAMLDAAIIALASALGVFMDGDTSVPPRTGNRHPALAMAPYNVYETSDGHIAIFTASDRHWESITRVLGREDLLTNPEYATTPGRAARVEEIDAMVTAGGLLGSPLPPPAFGSPLPSLGSPGFALPPSSAFSMAIASSGVIASVIYLKSMQRTNSSGLISATTCQTGLLRVFARRSHIALTTEPSAR